MWQVLHSIYNFTIKSDDHYVWEKYKITTATAVLTSANALSPKTRSSGSSSRTLLHSLALDFSLQIYCKGRIFNHTHHIGYSPTSATHEKHACRNHGHTALQARAFWEASRNMLLMKARSYVIFRGKRLRKFWSVRFGIATKMPAQGSVFTFC